MKHLLLLISFFFALHCQAQEPRMTEEEVRFWICRFQELDTTKEEHRQRLIDSFVNSVTIFDDHILITFNYKEGETRLDFSDIESSDLKSVGGPYGVS